MSWLLVSGVELNKHTLTHNYSIPLVSSIAAVAGGAVGAIVVVILVILLIIFIVVFLR